MCKTKTVRASEYMSNLGYPWQNHQWFSKTCIPVIEGKKKKWGREEVKVKGKREKFLNSQTG